MSVGYENRGLNYNIYEIMYGQEELFNLPIPLDPSTNPAPKILVELASRYHIHIQPLHLLVSAIRIEIRNLTSWKSYYKMDISNVSRTIP